MARNAALARVYQNMTEFWLRANQRYLDARDAVDGGTYNADSLARDIAGSYFDVADLWIDGLPSGGDPAPPTAYVPFRASQVGVTFSAEVALERPIPAGLAPVPTTSLQLLGGAVSIPNGTPGVVANVVDPNRCRLRVDVTVPRGLTPGLYQGWAIAPGTPIALIVANVAP